MRSLREPRPSSRPRTRTVALYARLAEILLPTSFFQDHGTGWIETFDALQKRARTRGRRAWWLCLLREGRDLARVAFTEHRAQRRRHTSVAQPVSEPSRVATRSHTTSGGFELLADDLLRDLRLSARSAGKAPIWTAVLVTTLAIGIGANATVAAVLHSLWLSPLPLNEPERIVSPFVLNDGDPFAASAVDVAAWRSLGSFIQVSAARAGSHDLLVDDLPRRISGAEVTTEWFTTLGTEPVLGRAMQAEDGLRSDLVWLGHQLWASVFAGDPAILGQTVILDGSPRQVVGVLPARFDLPFAAEAWMPLDLESLDPVEHTSRQFLALARLAPGISFEQARGEVETAAQSLAIERAASHGDWSADLMSLRAHLLDDADGRVTPSLLALVVAVGMVLLITCANLSNLLLARSTSRRRELEVRAALGAGRGRLTRQLLSEGLLLGMAGGVSGLALSVTALAVVRRFHPLEALAFGEALLSLRLEPVIAGVILAVSCGLGIALGAVPAVRLGALHRTPTPQGLDGRSVGGHRRFMAGVVVAEVALTVLLLTGATALFQSLQSLEQSDLGFRADDLLLARLQLPNDLERTAGEREDTGSEAASEAAMHQVRVQALNVALEDLARLPGIEAVAATSNAPLDHLSWDARVWPRRGALSNDELLLVADRRVTSSYLDTIGMRVIEGRPFDERDRDDSEPVAILTEDLARRLWPGQTAIGQQVKRGGPDSEQPWRTVVGVIAETKEDRAAFRRSRPAWYVPWSQEPTARAMTLVVRTDGDPLIRAAEIEAQLAQGLPSSPAYGMTRLQDQVATLYDHERFASLLSTTFAFIATLLAALGMYGLLAYATSQRTREIALRMALGARPERLVRGILGEGLILAGAGLALGVTGAWLCSDLLSRLLFRVDPLPFTTVAIVVTGVLALAALASWLPARDATRVDPTAALHDS